MTEFLGDDFPPIPNNTIRRLEESLKREEEGAESAILTLAHNFFDVPYADASCPHRQPDLEVERGFLYVQKQSSIIEVREEAIFSLTYTRTYTLDSEGDEVLDMKSQEVCFKKIDGEVEELLAVVPNTIPKIEVERVAVVSGTDDSSSHFVAPLDEFIREHIDEP